jgi:predicted lipoprotein with Yx(FWY)xxD motif
MSAIQSRRAQSRQPVARLALALSAAGLLAAACGGSSSGGSNAKVSSQTTPSGSTAAAGGATVTVATHKGPLGTYLTDSKGMSLYMFAADTTSKSACYGSCSTYWPPLLGSSAQTNGAANSAMTATTTRTDGTTQITYAGHPLYTYVGDKKPGDTKGEGLNLSGGKWWLLDPQGKLLSGSGSSNGSSGGYGSTGSGWS